jgi:hypothetical protein
LGGAVVKLGPIGYSARLVLICPAGISQAGISLAGISLAGISLTGI